MRGERDERLTDLDRHTFVAHSENVTMTNLDMNSTSNSQWKTVNTDGTDTWNSKDVIISNWTVSCGDVSTPLPPPPLGTNTKAGLHFNQRKQQQHKRLKRSLPRIRRNVHRQRRLRCLATRLRR